MFNRILRLAPILVAMLLSVNSLAQLPYSLPTAGNAVTIGTNMASDLASIFPASSGNSFFSSIFGQYGSGVFIRDYSPHGAYVVTSTGGHAAPFQLTGAVLFDFEDATWKGFENTNSVPSYLGQMTGQNNSNGDPWWEWTGSEVPLPSHTYLIPAELPASLGGGPKGSVLFLSHAACLSTGGGGRGPHALNLSTKRWSRLTSATQPGAGGIYTSVVFDEAKGRYYPVNAIEQSKHRMYYDASNWDSVHYTSPDYGWTPYGGGSRAFLDSVRRLIIDYNDGGFLYAFQLDNPGGSWTVLNVSGALPPVSAEPCRYAYYPPDGRFYFRPMSNGGAKLYRLTPPASTPLTSAWIADSVQLNQTMPDCAGPAWYNYMFYVPSLQCLAWIPNVSSQVYLFKPPAAGSVAETARKPVAAPRISSGPNPFSARSTVRVSLPGVSPAELTVCDISGKRVRTLFAGRLEGGNHAFQWDGTDGRGLKVPAGVYVYSLTSGHGTLDCRALLVR
jgi:hypothetical protein